MSHTKEKKKSKSENTKKLIQESALGLFRRKSFHTTSMREISAEAGVALGATYYYFQSKEEIVMDWYQATFNESVAKAEEIAKENRKLGERLDLFLQHKLQQLEGHEPLCLVIAASSLNLGNTISPFGPKTEALRDASIAMFQTLYKGSDIRASQKLEPIVPKILWLFQMALIWFWSIDSSRGKTRTELLKNKGIKLLIAYLKFSKLPLLSSINQLTLEIFEVAESHANSK